jgi:hypothetical protein
MWPKKMPQRYVQRTPQSPGQRHSCKEEEQEKKEGWQELD